ncbi:MAG TPA: hypothetical protein VJ476_14715 [Rhizomicrobium sp.]|nr:hypothetical protein [Rhizomicrobium sp.]
MPRRILLILVLLLLMPVSAAALPFRLSWVEGRCIGCQTARSLAEVQFVGPREAWGLGFNPPGETGAGDYAVLHSRDGGRTWREIPEPWQHNESPIISFSNASDGWLKDIDIVEAETRLLATHDGGAHWHRLPMSDLFVNQMQYLGGGTGYAAGYDIYKKQGYVLGTSDGGGSWSTAFLPRGFDPVTMAFSDVRHGALAGCLDERLTVITTADAGNHWRAHGFDLPQPPRRKGEFGCDYEGDGLGFLDAKHGWLLASKHSFRLNETAGMAAAWTTRDGGAHWQPVFHADFPWTPTNSTDFGGMTFLDARLGVLWKHTIRRKEDQGMLLYTTDGGSGWHALAMPRAMTACTRANDEVDCAGGGGFWSVRIVPALPR